MDHADLHRDAQHWRNYVVLLARSRIAPRFRSKVDVSDVVQQTMLEAHQGRQAFRGGSDGEYAAWLRRILARNLCNMQRDLTREKRDVHLERSLDDDIEAAASRVEWLAAEQSSPSQRADQRALVVRLADALAALPEDQRAAVELRHLEGWALKQIAEELQRSTAAVAGLLQRGLARLREQLCPNST